MFCGSFAALFHGVARGVLGCVQQAVSSKQGTNDYERELWEQAFVRLRLQC